MGKIGITICSAVFVPLGRAQSKALGAPQMPILVIPHPFGTRSRDEIRDIAAKCGVQLMAMVAEGPAK